MLVVLISLQGCDPAFRVVICNKSTASKTIQVLYPKTVRHPPDDSLFIYNVTANSYGYPLKIPVFAKDTVLRTYSFILQPGLDATVGMVDLGHNGYPMFEQMAIINNKDTVLLVRKNKLIVKQFKFMETTWKYTISD